MKKFLKLFDDSGKLIRFCAPIFAIAASVICLIWGISLIASTVENVFSGLLVIVFGTGCAWMLAFMIDGFGKLVQLGERLTPKEETLETFIPLLVEQEDIDDVVICGTCGASNKPGARFCISCGTAMNEDDAAEEYEAYSRADEYDPDNDPDLLLSAEEEEYEEEEAAVEEETVDITPDAFDDDVEEIPYEDDDDEEIFEPSARREEPEAYIGRRAPRNTARPAVGTRTRVQRPAGEQRGMRGRSHR